MAKKLSVPAWYCWCLTCWLNKPKTFVSIQGVGSDIDRFVGDPAIAISFQSPIGFGQSPPSGSEVAKVARRQKERVETLRFNAVYLVFEDEGVRLSAEAGSWSLEWTRFDYHQHDPKDIAVWLKANTPLVGNWYLPDYLPEGYDTPPG